MNIFFDNKLNKETVIIIPGELYSTEKDLIIRTLLGSCISVCLFSDRVQYAGMNHFMVPDKIDPENFHKTDLGRYGMYAMDKLIGEFIKRDIKKTTLRAKVFGGANIIQFKKEQETISSSNIKFIINYLDREGIPIISSHLGGNKARKIHFFTESKKVLLKEIDDRESILKKEQKYKKEVHDKLENPDIILFDS